MHEHISKCYSKNYGDNEIIAALVLHLIFYAFCFVTITHFTVASQARIIYWYPKRVRHVLSFPVVLFAHGNNYVTTTNI